MSNPPVAAKHPKANVNEPGDLEDVACLLCGSKENTPFLKAREYWMGVGGDYQIVTCKKCGHLFTSPRPTMETIHFYYPGDYYEAEEAPSKDADVRYAGVRERLIKTGLRNHFGYPGSENVGFLQKMFTWPLALWLRYGKKHIDALPWAGGGELLDFGCGGGVFLRKQRQRGWKVTGMDLSAAAAKQCKEKEGIDVHLGTWPGDCLKDRKFDVITGWHVIEHLPDPAGFVKEAASRLNPGGYLLICCPNAHSWAAWLTKEDWIGYDVPRHFSMFTPEQIKKLMADAGLEFEYHRPQSRYKSIRTSAQQRGKRTGSAWWKFLGKQKFVWRVVAYWAAVFGVAGAMVVVGRKPK
jgi:2-polyprenyl-3-methyl-5-hydroxy-6-metoxy-1,4-benzoquinol methylase